jgi:hypothetical protein
MYEKWLLLIGQQVICIKYNIKTGEITVGGNVRFRESMERILQDYLLGHTPRVKFVAANKIRFEFSLSRKKYDTGIQELQNNGFVVERTASHGRLMR